MISRIQVKFQNSQYISQPKRTEVSFTPKINVSQDCLSFKGASKSFRSIPIKFFERIKSRIPHSVVVISGPSGVGKDTVIAGIKNLDPNVKTSVSYTTRAMRPGEIHGENYYYISQDTFDKMNAKGEFFNQLSLNGNSYGGTLAELNSKRKGNIVFLNISSEEAYKAKDKYGKKAILIFLKPPSMSELENRLIKRGTETKEEIIKRLAYGKQQMECATVFDKIIVNDNLKTCVQETMSCIKERSSLAIKAVDSILEFLKKGKKTS